jgi:beta-glucanase (GH16 family)
MERENDTQREASDRRAGSSLWSSMSRLSLCTAALSLALTAPSGCGGGGGGTVTPVQQPAAAPVISPSAGSYTSSQSVTITDATTGATIYYTTNGTTPSTSSTQYSGAFTVSATETVEAIATAPNYTTSSVTSATFTISAPLQAAATPAITTSSTDTQNGAVIVTLADSTAGAAIYYTTDGSTPTSSSIQYLAPFLVDTNITVNAIAVASGFTNSPVATQTFSPNIASGTLVWEENFGNSSTTANAQPNPAVWTYDTGFQCCGNDEQETYCAWGSNTSPCNSASPNAFLAPNNGGLDIVAQNPSGTYYTSARLKSEGLFSFQYGRIEATMSLPESQGMWPAFWMLGNSITTISWPACGETDIMEHIDGAGAPFGGGIGTGPGYDWIAGSLHGGANSSSEVNASGDYPPSAAAAASDNFAATAVHTYGIIWTKGQVEFYVDSPSNIYETDTSSTFGPAWPFDQGPMFIILNLAVGGTWPGDVTSSTVFPSTMNVQDVKIYAN